MDLDEFLKELENANKRDLEQKIWGKANNNLKTRLTSWIKSFKMLEKVANFLGYEIKFLKTKTKK